MHVVLQSTTYEAWVDFWSCKQVDTTCLQMPETSFEVTTVTTHINTR